MKGKERLVLLDLPQEGESESDIEEDGVEEDGVEEDGVEEKGEKVAGPQKWMEPNWNASRQYHQVGALR